MAFDSITVSPMTPGLGAEVSGVDLSKPLSNRQADEVRRAFLDYSVLVFRDQDLEDPATLRRAGANFGEPMQTPFVEPMEGSPEIIDIIKEPEERGKYNFGGHWHSDVTFAPEPALGSLLYAMEVPPVGGDTTFADMRQAWDTLSDTFKGRLEGLGAIHSARRSYGSQSKFKGDGKQIASMRIENAAPTADREVSHPVMRTHPESGRKCLFVNPNYTTRLDAMTEEESKPILAALYAHALREEFQCRVRWAKATAVVWDNRCVMHRALNDYDGHRRHMRRVTLKGDRPY